MKSKHEGYGLLARLGENTEENMMEIMNGSRNVNRNQLDHQWFRRIHSMDAVSFFQALVEEGYRQSLLSAACLESIQYQLTELLADRFNRWTGGSSSSVTVETGQRIQQSVLYTIGYFLKSSPDPKSALEALETRKLSDLFKEGLQLLDTERKAAESMLHEVREHRFQTDVIAYNDTIQEGLSLFFSGYDTEFGAHESPGSVDYPLGNDKMNLTGLEYTKSYLLKLQMENEFCAAFSAEEIQSLLRGYSPTYHELLFSIYDLVFTNAIGGQLLGRSDEILHHCRLGFTDFERQLLQKRLSVLEDHQLAERVDAAVAGLCEHLPHPFTTLDGCTDYLAASALNLKTRLRYALSNQCLEHLFLTSAEEEYKEEILFRDIEGLDAQSLRGLANEIRSCRFTADKVAMVRNAPLSLRDLIDLLESACFFEEEYLQLFKSLEDSQLALLLRELPCIPEYQEYMSEDFNQEWQVSMLRFLEHLTPTRRLAIKELSSKIIENSLLKRSFC